LFEIFNKREKGKAPDVAEKDDDDMYYLAEGAGDGDDGVSGSIPA
jgi:hypothetical protein